MPVSVVVGGQFGSEGKGKVAHFLAKEMKASFAVRCGGSNSGHTVINEAGDAIIFQHLPTAAILPDVKLALCAGSYIDLDILKREIELVNADSSRLFIDYDAVIITDECKKEEASTGLIDEISSTGSGTGAAVISRIQRKDSIVFAKDIDWLKPYLADVSSLLREALDSNERVILEGTQGFGLSPLHSRQYPKVTSRDTTAAGFLSEVGLSPFDVDDVVLVIRAFPIRVAGNSGELPNEITWDELGKEAGYEMPFVELTSVTQKPRRVARFCPKVVKKAIQINKPTRIVLNHVDYCSPTIVSNVVKSLELNKIVSSFEKQISYSIDFIGTGQEVLVTRKLVRGGYE